MPLLLALALFTGCLLQLVCLLLYLYRVKIRQNPPGLLPWRLALAGTILICLRAVYESDFILLTGELLLLYCVKRLFFDTQV